MWSNKIEVVLRGKGLWTLVDGSENTQTAASELAKYLQRKDQAITILLISIDNGCLAPVIEKRDPKDIWDSLEKTFKTSSEVSVDAFISEYQSLRMNESEKIVQYVNRLTECENKLSAIGHSLTDKDKKRALSRGLPDEFNIIAGVIRATNKNIQESIGLLIVQEAENNSNQSNAASSTSTPAFTAQFKGRKKICNYCKRPGHIARHCFKNPESPRFKGNKNKAQSNQKQSDLSPESMPANVVSFMASQKHTSAQNQSWIIDSGASAHMCNDKNTFHDLKSTASVKTVSIGNGQEVSVNGMGSVCATTVVQGKSKSVVLRDVLFVPDLACNLISVPRCRVNGLKIVFDTDQHGSAICSAECKRTLTTVLCGFARSDNGLFEAILRPNSVIKGLTAITPSELLWHKRLGHVSPQTIEKSLSLVDGIPIKQFRKLLKCDTCLVGKSKRKTRKNKLKKNKSIIQPLELVHSDIQGPMKNPGLIGARYFVPLLDEATGLSMVRLLK